DSRRDRNDLGLLNQPIVSPLETFVPLRYTRVIRRVRKSERNARNPLNELLRRRIPAEQKMTAKPPPIAGLYLNCPLGGSSDLLLRRFRRPLALLLLAFFHNRLVCRVDGGFASIQFLDKPLGRLVALLSGLPNLLGRFVGAAGAKANGGSDFVAGFAFGPYGNISGG